MRASQTRNGLTVRVIAGTSNAILGVDLEPSRRPGCLGFSIRRTDLEGKGEPESRWLPNLLRFPADRSKTPATTLTAPLQKFRWGDYTCDPGKSYRYEVVARYGAPGKLGKENLDGAGVSVDVTMEDNGFGATGQPRNDRTVVVFNRGAAASHAFDVHFPHIKTEKQLLGNTEDAEKAKTWLSRGLQEALLSFMAQAKNATFALHAAIYEFQKPELLEGLKKARDAGASVRVVYHHRCKGPDDKTAKKNDDAIKKARLPKDMVVQRKAEPQNAIMHNKFVVLLKKVGKSLRPVAVWTGSTNWTDGAIYGQLNVGHAVYDERIATIYEEYFEALVEDPHHDAIKQVIDRLTPVSPLIPTGHGITPVLSPQNNEAMLHLYASICARSKCIMVCAPFALAPIILATFTTKAPEGSLRYFLLDKEASLGTGQEVHVIENDPANAIAVAATLSSPLHDFQGRLLEGKESYLHAGIHIHSKIILADPFGSDPIVVMGSANFSHNSTEVNDSNSLIFRGDTAVADIYATEFMRMFEHYHFRANEAHALTHASRRPSKKHVHRGAGSSGDALALVPDDSWSEKYYVQGSHEETDRRMFAGTH